MSDEPRIGITMGDPFGVGPELVARALAALAIQAPDVPVPIVFGDRAVLDAAARIGGVPLPARIASVTQLGTLRFGRPTGEDAHRAGAAQVAYLEAAISAIHRGEIDALVTAPINKALSKAAGFSFPGHTEFLADRLAAPGSVLGVAMMLAGPHLRVVPATIHIPLATVPAALAKPGSLAATIALTLTALHDDFGLPAPRVAVCGLNPHAGESGHFGDEEARLIAPAMEAARALLGTRFPFTLDGPHVPDAIFRAACAPPFGQGRYDAVVAMYHDQGLIPIKLVDFDDAVNVTLGLPIPRTSPDHGVAYDAAGTGRARDQSFRAALALARVLAKTRSNRRAQGSSSDPAGGLRSL